jgi:hypothetical protein
VLRRLPTGDAPCISEARLLRKFVSVVCEVSVPPIAETRLLKLDCRLLIAESDVVDAELVDAALVDEESLASDAASCSTRLCSLPP